MVACLHLTASAQLLRFFKKRPVLQPLAHAAEARPQQFFAVKPIPQKLPRVRVSRSNYDLELNELAVMRAAQHNMRFRIYGLASYNFNELARLYILQNRFSEAKWYFLQSSNISRQQNNYKLTFANLCHLGILKSEIGDFVLGQQDLLEARDIAASKGWLIEVIEAEKKLSQIRQKRMASLRTDLRYAETASID